MSHGRIFEKKSGSSIKYENVVKMAVFRLFLKNGSNDFDETWSECSSNHFRAFAKNRMSKSLPVPEIFTGEVDTGDPENFRKKFFWLKRFQMVQFEKLSC